jgi:CRISPR-associated helicase Cas3
MRGLGETMQVLERASSLVCSRYGELHPFQVKLVEACLDPDVGYIELEAPVGAGKTTAVKMVLEHCDKPVILTFPTTILIRTQSAGYARGMHTYHWPYDVGSERGSYYLSLIEYSSQSLLYLAEKNKMFEVAAPKGEILYRLFNLTPLLGKKRLFVTTPDVLWLMYSDGGKFHGSQRLQEALSESIIIFDEFHCYCDLKNFYKLLGYLAEGRVAKVVCMSATPFMRRDVALDFPGEKVHIRFVEDEHESGKKRIFNHGLEMEIAEIEYCDTRESLNFLTEKLKEVRKPAAVIFDSLFRLMNMEGSLKKEFPGLRFFRYDGLKKEKFVLNSRSVILGTSSIEVGIDMDFSSLIFEAPSWTAAIQRLGRVGRSRPGEACLVSNRSFAPYSPEREVVHRGEFEKILCEYLPDPAIDWVSGELFRGDSPTFLLVDRQGKTYTYGPGILSMFEIGDRESFPSRRREQEKLMREFGVEEEEIPVLLLRHEIFPYAGILEGRRMRGRYVPVKMVRCDEAEWFIEMDNGEIFYFMKEGTHV